jgi:hypothetical protein
MQRPAKWKCDVEVSNMGSSNPATSREPVARQQSTPAGHAESNSFAEYFKRSGTSQQQEHRTAGSLKLFRARHREPGSFFTPATRGVSIRMNRSQRDGTKMVDHGAGRFSGVLDRHYTVAPANLVGTCELSSELDFLAMEFSPDAFEEHLGTRGDLGRLHTGCQRDELVMQLVERLWLESVEGLTSLEADGLSMALVILLVRASHADFRKPDRSGTLSKPRLNRLFNYVENHLADDFNMADLMHHDRRGRHRRSGGVHRERRRGR